MPLLQDLTVEVAGYGSRLSEPITLCGEVPLRNLTLKGVSLQWESLSLTGLRSLHVSSLVGGLPTLATLQGMLSSSPQLVSIRFVEWTNRSDGSQSPSPSDSIPIHLPALQSLELGFIPRPTWEYLLSTIRSAPLQKFILSTTSDRDFVVAQSGSSGGLYQLMEPVLQRRTPIEIRICKVPGPMDVVRISQGENRIQLLTSSPYRSLPHVADFFLAMHVTAPIAVYLSDWRRSPDETAEIPSNLLRLPSITHIRTNLISDANQLLEQLANRHLDDDGTSSWLCPRLETLNFANVEGLSQAVVDSFRQRRGVWDPQTTDEVVPPPLPLLSLDLPPGLI